MIMARLLVRSAPGVLSTSRRLIRVTLKAETSDWSKTMSTLHEAVLRVVNDTASRAENGRKYAAAGCKHSQQNEDLFPTQKKVVYRVAI